MADITRRSRRRRTAVVAASAVGAIAVVGAVALLRDGGSKTGPAQPTTTTHEVPTSSSTSVAPTTTEPRPTIPTTEVPLVPAAFTPSAVAVPVFAGGPVQTVTFSPDGRRIVARLGGAVSILDATTGREVAYRPYAVFDNPLERRISTNEDAVAVSLDGTLLFDGTALWQVLTGAKVVSLDTSNNHPVFSVFSADGSTLAVATSPLPNTPMESAITVVDTTTGARTELLTEDKVGSVALSDDGSRLMTWSLRQVLPKHRWALDVWDVASGTRVRSVEYDDPCCGPWSISTGPDSFLKADESAGRWILGIFDAATLQRLVTFGDFGSSVDGISRPLGYFSADGSIVAVSSDRGLVVFDAANGSQRLAVPNPSTFGCGGPVRSNQANWIADVTTRHRACFSPNGSRAAAASDVAASVDVWDTATGALIATLRGHNAEIVSAAFSPNGRTIVSASLDGTVRLWTTP